MVGRPFVPFVVIVPFVVVVFATGLVIVMAVIRSNVLVVAIGVVGCDVGGVIVVVFLSLFEEDHHGYVVYNYLSRYSCQCDLIYAYCSLSRCSSRR